MIFWSQIVLKTALNSCFNLQFCYWPLLIKNGLHLYFLKECEVTLTWLLVGRLTHSTSSKPTAWIKKPPRVEKKPWDKAWWSRGGRGTLYAETIQMCGYNMSTPTPLSNLSPPEASEFELFLLNRTQGHIIIYNYKIVRITGWLDLMSLTSTVCTRWSPSIV